MASEIATITKAVQSFTGCVKWFNNGLNYGFITVLSDCEYRNTDVFVHQSNIRTGRDCFRTLYTDECVQFELAKSDNEKHPFHAINVQGFNGVKLRCEAPRGTGFGSSNGRGHGNSRVRGGSRGFRGPRQTGANQQPEISAMAIQDAKTAYTESSTNAVESTPQTSANTSVNTTATTVEAVPSSAAASGAKSRWSGRGRGSGRGRKISA